VYLDAYNNTLNVSSNSFNGVDQNCLPNKVVLNAGVIEDFNKGVESKDCPLILTSVALMCSLFAS